MFYPHRLRDGLSRERVLQRCIFNLLLKMNYRAVLTLAFLSIQLALAMPHTDSGQGSAMEHNY